MLGLFGQQLGFKLYYEFLSLGLNNQYFKIFNIFSFTSFDQNCPLIASIEKQHKKHKPELLNLQSGLRDDFKWPAESK